MANEEFIEKIHFYFDESGLMVMTEKYLLERGFCCGKGCRHCPFDYENAGKKARKELSPKKKNLPNQ
ncbi:MAG: hypothetical protein KGM16_15190 [Bacteroidota bacterium]|nr:hypothetical protein [Bacteroidota bacterium]